MSAAGKAAKAASARAKLLALSKHRGIAFDLLAQRYAIERLLLRLQRSPYEGVFILKGALVFLTWGVDLPRPTRDLDLMGFVPADPSELGRIFSEIIAVPVEEDGWTFLPESILAEYIREDDLYSGGRVKMRALKFEAMVKLGEQNSRMKDFFDLW